MRCSSRRRTLSHIDSQLATLRISRLPVALGEDTSASFVVVPSLSLLRHHPFASSRSNTSNLNRDSPRWMRYVPRPSRCSPTLSLTLPIALPPPHLPQLKKIPPFTRTLVLGVLAVTGPTLLHLISPYNFAFIPHRIAANWEVWRLATPFLFGGGGLNLVFSLIMLYRSLVDLEESHFGRRLGEMSAFSVSFRLSLPLPCLPFDTSSH